MHNVLIVACLAFTFGVGACSVPNLESAECSGSREVVKRYYSRYVFGEEEGAANPEFLSNQLIERVRTSDTKAYFTAGHEGPRAFRVAECTLQNDGRATLIVQLLWRDDNSSEQREIKVETARGGSGWVIDGVSN